MLCLCLQSLFYKNLRIKEFVTFLPVFYLLMSFIDNLLVKDLTVKLS